MRFQLWPEVTQLLDGACSLRPAGCQHAVPIGPRYAVRRTHLFTRQRCVDGSVQFRWPSGSAARLPVRHKVQVQAGEIVACRQHRHFGLLSLPDDLAMHPYEVADRGVGEEICIIGLPAEQASD